MPFTAQLVATIAAAEYPQLNDLSRDVWRALAAGVISDDEAHAASLVIEERRRATTGGSSHIGGDRNNAPATVLRGRLAFPELRRQRSPDKQRSIERRRRLAASGPLPPLLASRFTTSWLAVLHIVGAEVKAHGLCALHVDAIAARAGVCRTTVQDAIREARALGLLTVEERRRRGQPSLTNLVRVISNEWRTWLRLTGFRFTNSTGSRYSKRDDSRHKPRPPVPLSIPRTTQHRRE
jgi:hypothetical protein